MNNIQMTREFFKAYEDEVLLVIADLGLFDLQFALDYNHKPINATFSEVFIDPGSGFVCRFDWNFITEDLTPEEKFIVGLREVIFNLRLLWQFKTGLLNGCSREKLIDEAMHYIDNAIKRLARKHPESRFAELVPSDHYEELPLALTI